MASKPIIPITINPPIVTSSSFSINQIILDFLKTQKGNLLSYFIFEMLSGYFDVIVPRLYGKITESLQKKEDLTPLFMKLMAAWTGSKISTVVMDQLDAKFIPAIQTYIRTNLVSKLLDAYKENYQEPEVADMISTIVKLPNTVYELVQYARSFIIPVSFSVMWTMFYMFKIHKSLGLAYTFGVVSICFQSLRIVKNCYSSSTEYDAQNQNVHEEIGDILSNLISVYSSNATDSELQRLEKVQEEMDKLYTATLKCGSRSKLIFNMIFILFFGLLNYIALDLYKKGEISFGEVTSAFVMLLNILNFISDIGKQTAGIVFNVGVYNRIQEYLNNLASRKAVSITQLRIPVYGEIVFDNITIENTPITNFKLKINPGEKIALIGKIGSGKSSLIKALLKIMPYRGSLRIDGQEVSDISPDHLRQQVSYIAQTPILFNRSIYENILYGTKKTHNDVDLLIDIYKLKNVFGNRNLSDPAGKNGEYLSGGQRQIVMLLRNLFNPKPILVLDEPTASLNQEMKGKVLGILSDLAKNKEFTMIIISHDPIAKDLIERVVDISKQ